MEIFLEFFQMNNHLVWIFFFSINTIADVISVPQRVHGLNSCCMGNRHLGCPLHLLCRHLRVSSTLESETLPVHPQHLSLDANWHTYATSVMNSRKTLYIIGSGINATHPILKLRICIWKKSNKLCLILEMGQLDLKLFVKAYLSHLALIWFYN